MGQIGELAPEEPQDKAEQNHDRIVLGITPFTNTESYLWLLKVCFSFVLPHVAFRPNLLSAIDVPTTQSAIFSEGKGDADK